MENNTSSQVGGNGLFISHAHDDVELVRALKTMLMDLYSNYFDIFATAVTPLKGGQVWRDEIREHIAKAKVMIVLITPISVRRIWIPFEAGAAWLDSIDRKKVLIPCRFNYADFTSPLSEHHGVNLLSRESIEDSLIPALNDVSGLTPSMKYLPKIIDGFFEEVANIKEQQDALIGTTEGSSRIDYDRLFELTIGYFKDDKNAARKYMDMLKRHDLLIDEDLYQDFLVKLNAQ